MSVWLQLNVGEMKPDCRQKGVAPRRAARHNSSMHARRVVLLGAFAILLMVALVAQRPAVEAVEIGKHNTNLLPAGKEADGIIGDFVLRNEYIQALVSGNLPLRRANMSTEYAFPTPGSLY